MAKAGQPPAREIHGLMKLRHERATLSDATARSKYGCGHEVIRSE
jgi:hypothetical protein